MVLIFIIAFAVIKLSLPFLTALITALRRYVVVLLVENLILHRVQEFVAALAMDFNVLFVVHVLFFTLI